MGHEPSGAVQELGQQPHLRFPCPLAHEGTSSHTSKRPCFKKLGNKGETPNYLHFCYVSLSSHLFLGVHAVLAHTCTHGTLEHVPEVHPCLWFWFHTSAGVPETKPQRTTERAQSTGSPPPAEKFPGNRGPRTGPEKAWGRREERMLAASSPPTPRLNHWGGCPGLQGYLSLSLSLLPSHKARAHSTWGSLGNSNR